MLLKTIQGLIIITVTHLLKQTFFSLSLSRRKSLAHPTNGRTDPLDLNGSELNFISLILKTFTDQC